jgi:hypothetical protein
MKPRISYANVASTLALFLAVAGTSAWAVTTLPSRSVGEFQLRPGAVTASKLRRNAVTAPKIKALAVKQGKIANGSITAAKLTPGSVASSSIQEGSIVNSKLAADAVTGEKALESTFSQVPSAARADSAGFADSADPAAFGFVAKEAVLDQNLSKGIASVQEGSLGGIYCVRVQGFNPRGAQVTVRYAGNGSATAYAVIGGTIDCPAPAIEVQTFEGGARTKAAFYLVAYR